MIQLVVFSLLFSAVAINGNPIAEKLPPVNSAEEARRLVHQANWASVGTISTDNAIVGYPMVTLLSVADSKENAPSTGDIFFYMMNRDIAALDTEKDKRITFMFTDAQIDGCKSRNADPWSHDCPKVFISGEVKKLEKNTEEYTRGLDAFESRHPSLVSLSSDKIPGHNFIFCKLDVKNIIVFSGYGGYKRPSIGEYYAGTDSINA